MTDERIAVVTGGSSGIGAAIARALATRGWRCVLLARREAELHAVAEEIGGEYEVCDVGDRGAVDRTAATVLERHPKIGLLVNNAGIPGRIGFVDGDPERIELITRVNYLGGVWCLRAFLPGLLAAAPSDVVNVASAAGTVTAGTSGPYAASKHAQVSFSRAIAAELQPHGITAHLVMPGFVETEGFPQKTVFPRYMHRVIAEPEDVADAVLKALDHGKRELFVPWYYRFGAISQALFPGAVARTAASGKLRKPA
ncbi:MAG TPA: SDR family oxidoreductase [Gaiellaceae bacterium]|nr:SDR family oxidoreductase [Gaiellaceae bacterium]